jgi:hypothetical protein
MMTRARIIRRCTRLTLIFSAAHQQSCSSPAATASRRHGNDLGTTIKYLRKTASGAAGIGLGTTIKYPRRTTGAAAGNCLGTTVKYLRRTTSGAAGNGRAQ